MSEFKIEWMPPPGEVLRSTTTQYPWEELLPPQTVFEEIEGEEVEVTKYSSFFVPRHMKNPAATVAKLKDRYPDRVFEWRRTTESWPVEVEVLDNDMNVVGTRTEDRPTRGVRFWRMQ